MNNNIKDINSLTPSQEGMYAQYFQKTDTKTYQLQNVSRISKDVDLKLLEKSVELLSMRHQILKSAFTVLKSTGAIKQVILENRKPAFTVILQDKPFSQEALDKVIETNTKAYLDLQTDPLFRVTIVDFNDQRFMIMHAHHIILDGWCLPVIINDIQKYYGELYNNRPTEVLIEEIKKQVSSETSYAQYANWIRKQNTDKIYAYWQSLLEDCSPAHIYGKEKKDNSKNEDIVTFLTPLNDSLSKSIEQFAKENKISPNSVFECMFSIALQKFSGSEDVIFDKIISGRSISLKNIENTVGPFINTVPVRIRTSETSTLADVLKETQNQTINANTNGILSLGELYKQTGIDARSVDSLFVFENYFVGDEGSIQNGPLAPQLVSFDEQTEFNLTVTILKENNGYAIRTSYAKDFYTEREVENFVNGYISVLNSSLDTTKLIKDIDVLTTEEKEKVISSFNNTEHTYDIPNNSTLYSLFEAAADKNKDKVCIKINEKEITFSDFRAYAERIDNEVRNITDNSKSVIAVICERSFEMYGAVYGVIRGGNAYLPIDPSYPQERIDYILRDSGAKAVIAQEKFCHLTGDIPCIDATAIFNDTEQPTKTECSALSEDTAYVIYTSGSTGNPKGAKINHKSAINRILWMHDSYPLEENDVILQKTPYTFDVSVWELFWWGIMGRCLCASKPDEHFLPAKILNEVENHEVTHLHFVPSVFDLFLTYLENNPEEKVKFNSVKYVFLSGEALTANHISRFYNIYDYSNVTLHNLYGPTECAVDVSYYACSPIDIDPVPIGKPIYNTQLYIVDKYLNPTPVGVKGELCIAGANVGQGYLNNETLTKEKFIDNPFGEGKLYKTGDLAYWREDGEVVFCGRMDGQIKLHGQRIELGEIENAINAVDGIDSVAVIVKKQDNQEMLVAFYSGTEVQTKVLKTICEKSLPKYMVPSAFVYLLKLPLNSSGKLDRKVLVNMAIDVIAEAVEEPKTENERVICEYFKNTLNVENIGRNSDFFDFGGTSLLMISLLSDDYFKNVPPADFISNSTPRLLARFLDRQVEKQYSFVKSLKIVEDSKKAIICFPYGGGGAEAYAVFSKTFMSKSQDYSILFVPFLRSHKDCAEAAEEILELSKKYEIYFYSHCAGAVVAMDILNILERNGKDIVRHYISAGMIPLEVPQKENFWNTVSNEFLLNGLNSAGASFDGMTDEQVDKMLSDFRKDTDFMTEYFYTCRDKIKTPISLVLSKTDIFTENYQDAQELWARYSENLKDIHFIETNSHYFQKDNSNELIDIILNII